MKPTKNLFLILLGRVGSIVILFSTYRILTHQLDHSEVGLFYFYQSFVMAMGLIVVGPIGAFMFRKFNEWLRVGHMRSALYIFTLFMFAISLCAFVLLFLTRGGVSAQVQLEWYHCAIIGLYILINSWSMTTVTFFNLQHKRTLFVTFSLVGQLLALIVAVIAVIYFSQSAAAWLLGLALGQLIVAIAIFLTLRSQLRDSQRVDGKKFNINWVELSRFCAPVAFANMASWFLLQSYRPIVTYFRGAEQLAGLALGLSLANALAVALEYFVQQYYFPGLYQAMEDESGRQRNWLSYYEATSALYFFVGLFLFVAAPFLIILLADAKFYSAWPFVAIGAFCEYFRLCTNNLTLGTQSEMKTHLALRPYLYGSIVTVVSMWLVIQLEGRAEWIALSMMAGSITVFVSLYYKMRSVGLRFQAKQSLKLIMVSAPLVVAVYVFFDLHTAPSFISSLLIATVLAVFVVGAFFMTSGDKLKGLEK